MTSLLVVGDIILWPAMEHAAWSSSDKISLTVSKPGVIASVQRFIGKKEREQQIAMSGSVDVPYYETVILDCHDSQRAKTLYVVTEAQLLKDYYVPSGWSGHDTGGPTEDTYRLKPLHDFEKGIPFVLHLSPREEVLPEGMVVLGKRITLSMGDMLLGLVFALVTESLRYLGSGHFFNIISSMIVDFKSEDVLDCQVIGVSNRDRALWSFNFFLPKTSFIADSVEEWSSLVICTPLDEKEDSVTLKVCFSFDSGFSVIDG
ncbi:MAG: hypothetical protein A2493_01805 [Candidatus Magasanikbacteria bacterium RIFOXYC12_FULL_33_11]|uniref:Uncharacterized protein n=1 Tax=Candidatus Magasanikbacteria bacterium RIFOXYC12_FULL_33_11 TaxID=1798701 RepID=A0A1F6NSD8_9BACT|nr:MAG: hypothetical protein A2493_01805 [Candidatus Magasanikbacteria bacterium RIFOXYC12_FULL_33_11]